MSKKYQHIFFDLDHTLWDYEKNAEATLAELFEIFNLGSFGIAFSDFKERSTINNRNVWELYRKNIINRDTLRRKRFLDTFLDLGVEEKYFPESLPDMFLELCPKHTHLIDGTKEVIGYLHEKYQLHIITNGFEESQYKKLQNCDILGYFDKIITADKAGAKKPEPEIFEYSLNLANAEANQSLMVGDELEFDIRGAQNFGIDQVYFNPDNNPHQNLPTYSITHLKELITIL